MDTVSFHLHDIVSPFDDQASLIVHLCDCLQTVAKLELVEIADLSYVFVSDEYLLEMNQKHLNHDTYTDILTFDLSDDPKANLIEGEIYISLDRVKDNALSYSSDFLQELRRVVIHGLLHLIGYNDHSEEEKKVMRSKEDYYLELV